MERLTYRDRKGCAYFDDDGSLIRGANGAFHQKKDMTGQFIHQRFVALDKTIDRLAAYEDTGLEPEEIMAMIAPPNPPLTVENLLGMDGDKIFIHYVGTCRGFCEDEEAPYYGRFEQYVHEYNGMLSACDLPLKYYGELWIAYRCKPEEESR